MPRFELSPDIEVKRTVPHGLKDARTLSERVLESYRQRGFDVSMTDTEEQLIGARIENDEGTAISVHITLSDEGGQTELHIGLKGSVFVGGFKGRLASAALVRSTAERELAALIDATFSGVPPESDTSSETEPSSASEKANDSDPTPTAEGPDSEKADPGNEARPPPSEDASSASSSWDDVKLPPPLDELLLLKKILNGDLDDADAPTREQAAKDVIVTASATAASVGLQPIPGLDLALLVPVHLIMVQCLGRLHGYRISRTSAKELIGTFGLSLIAHSAMVSAAKLVPIAGWILGMMTAYAMTYALGEVVNIYFLKGRTASAEELKKAYKEAFTRAKKEKEAEVETNADIFEKIEQLMEAYKAELVSEEEYNRKKTELLRRL